MPQPSLGCTDTGHTDTDRTGKREPPIGRNNRTTITLSERGYCLTIRPSYFYATFFIIFFLLFISLLLFFPSACQYENLEVIKVPERIAIFFYCMHRWVFFRYVQCLYTGMGQKRAPYRNGFIYNQVKGECYICLGSHAQGKQTYSPFSETSFEGNNPGGALCTRPQNSF